MRIFEREHSQDNEEGASQHKNHSIEPDFLLLRRFVKGLKPKMNVQVPISLLVFFLLKLASFADE